MAACWRRTIAGLHAQSKLIRRYYADHGNFGSPFYIRPAASCYYSPMRTQLLCSAVHRSANRLFEVSATGKGFEKSRILDRYSIWTPSSDEVAISKRVVVPEFHGRQLQLVSISDIRWRPPASRKESSQPPELVRQEVKGGTPSASQAGELIPPP